jgi:spore coat polysaccharide biosynthesis protein SpsF
MGSTRLPNKVLADIAGRPMLARVVDRVRSATALDDVILATSTARQDDAIEQFCRREGVACFRGSEEDVLDRYYQAARWAGAEIIARITADCPLHDPAAIDMVAAAFVPGETDYVSNSIERTFPDGLDVEVFSFGALDRAWREAKWSSEREHVTAYIWKHPDIFRIRQVTQAVDRSAMRWTVDEPRDLELVREVYRRLGTKPFGQEEVVRLLEDETLLAAVNAGIVSNEGYLISLQKDRIVGPAEES